MPDEEEAMTTSGRAFASISPISVVLMSGLSGAFYHVFSPAMEALAEVLPLG